MLAFGKSLAFVSLFISAWAALVGLGALIEAGDLRFWPIWVGGAMGAAIGDWVSYWVGINIGPRVGEMWRYIQRFCQEAYDLYLRAIAYHVASELRDVFEDFKNYRMLTTIQRLALRSDQDAGGNGMFVLPYGKRIWASQLGMAPENLSRNLAALAPLGVTVHGRVISLSDRTALAELARLPSTWMDLRWAAAHQHAARSRCAALYRPQPGRCTKAFLGRATLRGHLFATRAR
jgi:hypothetical protein